MRFAPNNLRGKGRPSPPNTLVQRNTIAPATLTLDGGGTTTGIGFFLVGLSIIPLNEYRIDVAAADGELFTETFMGAGTLYRGFASPAGIVSVTVSPVLVDGSEGNFDFDDVSLGVPVPEPSAVSLILIGAILAGGYSTARRRSWS
jgi:hypothetical protein